MSHSDTVRKLLKIFEKMNVPEAMTMFAENAIYQFGNYPAAVGLEQIRQAAAASHMDFIKTCTFDVKNMLEPAGGDIICEMIITYVTTDGRTISLPCADMFRFDDKGLIKELRIFMDATPLFAKPANA